MSKINYTKVEEMLLSSQQKQQRERLLQEAHMAHMAQFAQGGGPRDAAEKLELAEQQQREKDHALAMRLKVLQQRLRWFFKQDPQFYTLLGVPKETIVHYLDCQAKTLTPEDWRTIEQLYAHCLEKKPAIEEAGGITTNEKLIKKARRKQKKRPFKFNQNDRWLAT